MKKGIVRLIFAILVGDRDSGKASARGTGDRSSGANKLENKQAKGLVVITLEWQGDLRFLGRTGPGEAATEIDGDGKTGPTPVSLFLESIGACTGGDVVDILRKGRQELHGLAVEVEAERRADPPRYVKKLTLRYRISGPVDRNKAQRAVDLSLEKYCSVFQSLRMDIALDVEVEVRE